MHVHVRPDRDSLDGDADDLAVLVDVRVDRDRGGRELVADRDRLGARDRRVADGDRLPRRERSVATATLSFASSTIARAARLRGGRLLTGELDVQRAACELAARQRLDRLVRALGGDVDEAVGVVHAHPLRRKGVNASASASRVTPWRLPALTKRRVTGAPWRRAVRAPL